ncbi:hypothetical protein [Streptomyces sp. NRRL S-118]|uniref:hypothetical protein n=1 Tax=Streptomyces sp. NRRL S-118 TaxID=1463881 RepID=UPI0004C5760E|nr:hypothetical protein [Streptomyces sp. NRRL S-118]
MSDRREAEVRRLLEAPPHPRVPEDLLPRAVARGGRRLRHARAVRRTGWLLLTAAGVAFVVWASAAEPWAPPPSGTTPVVEGF